MSGLNDSNTTDQYDQVQTVLMGGTDNTKIGNVSDKLKVDAVVSFPASQFPSIGSNFRVDDMNASNGGIARGTTITTSWSTVYSYSGAGHLFGFLINFSASTGFKIRLSIDSVYLFNGSTGVSTTDLSSGSIYDMIDVDIDQIMCSYFMWNNGMSFQSPLPITYATSVQIQVARETGTGTFRAGLVNITKN